MAAKSQKPTTMQQQQTKHPGLSAFSGKQFRPTVIILSSTVLMLTWKYYGSVTFFRENLAGWLNVPFDTAATAAIYSFSACFVLLGLIPILIVKLVFRQSLADYGIQLGNRFLTVRSFIVMAPFCVLIGYASSGDPTIVDAYPINTSVSHSMQMFVLHAVTYFLFYLGWEFHFRGFLQFGLQEKLGTVNALLVQVLASSLLHIGKPDIETFASIAAGVIWGITAYKTRSLLSGTLQHYALGISLDWFITHG